MPRAVEIKLHRRSARLEVVFDDGSRHELSAEYLRISSPSAELRGHGGGPAILPLGKENVAIVRVDPVGHYAVRLVFDDGHDTGLYTWEYLHRLGVEFESRWAEYLRRLEAAGQKRKPRAASNGEPD